MDEGKRKGFVAPAFSVEFMTYFTERNRRIEEAKEAQTSLEKSNDDLKREEFALRHKYEQEIQKAEDRKKETKSTQVRTLNIFLDLRYFLVLKKLIYLDCNCELQICLSSGFVH